MGSESTIAGTNLSQLYLSGLSWPNPAKLYFIKTPASAVHFSLVHTLYTWYKRQKAATDPARDIYISTQQVSLRCKGTGGGSFKEVEPSGLSEAKPTKV
jgi:hypothetical protein